MTVFSFHPVKLIAAGEGGLDRCVDLIAPDVSGVDYSALPPDSMYLPTVTNPLLDVQQGCNSPEFRRVSVLEDVCRAKVYGKGVDGYREALASFIERYDDELPAVAPDGGLARGPFTTVHDNVSMYVEDIWAGAPYAGATMLYCSFPNTWIDVNRNGRLDRGEPNDRTARDVRSPPHFRPGSPQWPHRRKAAAPRPRGRGFPRHPADLRR